MKKAKNFDAVGRNELMNIKGGGASMATAFCYTGRYCWGLPNPTFPCNGAACVCSPYTGYCNAR